jgi:hypothetical protein
MNNDKLKIDKQNHGALVRYFCLQQVKQYAESYALQYVEPAFNGDVQAAGSLAQALGNDKRGTVAVTMWRAKVERRAFRAFLAAAWEHDYAYIISAAETRRRLAAMFSYAEFSLPTHLPEIVRVWRGTHGLTPRQAAKGFSWTTERDVACWFAYFRNVDRAPQVITAIIPKEQIAYFSNERGEQEAILMRPPKSVCIDGNIEDWLIGYARHQEQIQKSNQSAIEQIRMLT